MSKPRNPRYFPRMKVRGARRRQIAPIQRMEGAFDHLNAATKAAAETPFNLRAVLAETTNETTTEAQA